MEQGFIDILKTMVDEQGSNALTDAKKCKALLADYTKNEYKKERRLLLQAVEAGAANAIEGADDLTACKKAKIRELEEEQALNSAAAADIVNTLALVLRGDTNFIESPSSVPAPAPAPAAAPAGEPVKKQAEVRKEKRVISSRIMVELKNVTKFYGEKGSAGVRAVHKINFNVREGEFVLLLGPLNAGKTAILKLIAGVEDISEGELFIDGKLMNKVPAAGRNIAIIPEGYIPKDGGTKLPVLKGLNAKKLLSEGKLSLQNTAYENITFDLQSRKVPKAEIDKRVNEAAKLLDIGDALLYRELKGHTTGQRYKVALARCIVFNPKVFLFDDPLAEIDAMNHASKLRAMLRDELAEVLGKLNATTIYATCDHDEAMIAMADRVINLKDGEIV